MDADHGVPFVDRHIDEHPVTQNAGVVDQDIDRPEVVDRRLDQATGAVVVRDVVTVGHGFPTHPADLLDDFAGWAGGASASVDLGPQVVDDHFGPLAGELEGMLTPDAPAPSGDGDDAPVTNAHGCSLSLYLRCHMSRLASILVTQQGADRSSPYP